MENNNPSAFSPKPEPVDQPSPSYLQTQTDKVRPRRKCQFNADLQIAYPTFNLMNPTNPHVVICNACLGIIDVSNSGRSSLEKHLKMRKHIDAVATSLSQVMHDDSKQETLPNDTALDDDAQSDNAEDVPNVGEYVSTSLQEETQPSSDTTGKPAETHHSSLKGPKKRRREVFAQSDNAIASSPNETTNTKITTCHHQQEDQFSIFGQLVAEQLRQLSPKRRILTQGRLNAILQEALLEELENPSSDPP